MSYLDLVKDLFFRPDVGVLFDEHVLCYLKHRFPMHYFPSHLLSIVVFNN